MPPGQLTFAADTANRALLAALLDRFPDAQEASGDVDVLITERVPDQDAHHIVVTGELDDDLDQWDRNVAAQTVAGALWLTPDQEHSAETVSAWLLLRTQTPTTPLSDLTDQNERALRWSVAAARPIDFPAVTDVDVDEEQIRAWADAQPQVQELGNALERLGGDNAAALLDSLERFQNALTGLDELAPLPPLGQTRDLTNAIAEQLQQVQRSGFGRLRSGKARVQAAETTRTAAKDLAAQRLIAVIDSRTQEVASAQRAQQAAALADEIRDEVEAAVTTLRLPTTPDFAEVPRPWSGSAPAPRRYVLLNEAHADLIDSSEDYSVRYVSEIAAGSAVCAIVQSGFSLPALRI